MYRIDHHPTMSQHPVTPMKESDLRLHLAGQTELSTGLFNITDQQGDLAAVRERLLRLVETERPELVLFDVLDDLHLETVGRLLWEEASRTMDTEASAMGSTQGTETTPEPDGGLFVIGSSGVEYALTMAWRAAGRLNARGDETPPRDEAGEVSQLLVVSGSCSPVTERQLQQAIEAGYAGIRVPAALLVQADRAEQVCAALKREALDQLAAGRSVLLYSAAGPQDPAIGELREQLAEHGRSSDESSRMLGSALGVLARELVREAGLTRIVIAGGDTSGYVTRELGIYALECVSTLEPGGPICRAHSTDPGLDGLELALKGGQVGSDSFLSTFAMGESDKAGRGSGPNGRWRRSGESIS
ncbi:hypothetical protein N6H14_23885 [Paenibacillus sp. CC-CFT747]|nr:hypothetical protein N6H14_23885 [Paenibacillus sp. CC-CFT747]